jgi:hypothetical protein
MSDDQIVIVDPAVQAVHESYEKGVTFFMAHISQFLAKFNEQLQIVLPHNPVLMSGQDVEDGATETKPMSPMLRRSSIDGSVLKKQEDEAVQLLKKESPAFRFRTMKISSGKAEEGTAVNLKETGESEAKISTEPKGKAKKRPEPETVSVAKGSTKQAEGATEPSEKESATTKSTTTAATAAEVEKKGAEVSEKSAATKNPALSIAVDSKQQKVVEPKKDTKNVAPTDDQLDTIAMPPLLLVQLKKIKQEARSLGRLFDQIHDWIALNIPMMKDEDNVGVAVMASVIADLELTSAAIRELYDLESSYLSDRMEREVTYVKTPEADSTLQAIAVCDADMWNSVEKGWRVLMRVVLMTHSTLSKNMKALKNPRAKPGASLNL